MSLLYCNKSSGKVCKHDNLLVLHPELCQEWDYERNAKGPQKYAPGSSSKVW